MHPVVRLLRQLVVNRSSLAWHARVDHDPFARLSLAAVLEDPYPIYAEVRKRGAVVPSPTMGFQTATHAVCREVLRDRRFGVRADDGSRGDGQMSLLELDPPDHTRLRRLAAPAFTPRSLAASRGRITAVVDGLLDGLPRSEPFDLVSRFAAPLPIAVITDLLGVPAADSAEFARHGATIGSALAGPQSLAHVGRLVVANRRLDRLLGEVFEQHRREPGDDLVSRLVAAEGDQLRREELRPLCLLLLVAGFETTVNLIGNTVMALLEHPDQWQAVADDPDLADAAVEETLRWDPPVQRTLRVAYGDVEVAGVRIPSGSMLLLYLAGANRDPAAFEDPDRFDLWRTGGAEHLAFSAGIHYCLGAPLSRMEAGLAVRGLVRRFPGLARAGRLRRRPGAVIRGAAQLVVRSPARAA